MAQRVKPYIVGVDVSKDKLDIYEQWSEKGYEVSNEAASIEAWLTGYEVGLQIALEPTNSYHREVSEQAAWSRTRGVYGGPVSIESLPRGSGSKGEGRPS